MSRDKLLEEAARMWTAAETLDAIHGGDTAWQWTGDRVHELLEEGRAGDPAAVAEIADALEARLERDRREVGT